MRSRFFTLINKLDNQPFYRPVLHTHATGGWMKRRATHQQ